MLSKIDIENQIGRGINIVPFKIDNIKENSVNLTLSEIAWSVTYDKDEKRFKRAQKVCENEKVVLHPHSTTIVYTKEVISLNGKFGGTFHAKVGIVAKGVIFSSTTLGPWYCGHLMITIQNPNDFEIELKVGETFISLVLYKLDTPLKKMIVNSNNGGHTEKLSYYGIQLDDYLQHYFDQDWKKNHSSIREKLLLENEYSSLKNILKVRYRKRNMILGFILVVISVLVYFLFSSIFKLDTIPNILTTVSTDIVVGLIMIVVDKFTGFLNGLFNNSDT